MFVDTGLGTEVVLLDKQTVGSSGWILEIPGTARLIETPAVEE